jgi:hypothetical protein
MLSYLYPIVIGSRIGMGRHTRLWLFFAIAALQLFGIQCWAPIPCRVTTRSRIPLVLRSSVLPVINSTGMANGLIHANDLNESPSSSYSSSSSSIISYGMGDIMGRRESKLLLHESGLSLAQLYGIHSPLDRMLTTANGNLQRLFASYYDTQVEVVVLKCSCRNHPSSDSKNQSSSSFVLPAIWDRVVELRLQHRRISTTTTTQSTRSSSSSVLLCTAQSEITISSYTAADAIAGGRVGIGQWFRHSNILPTFELHDAGYNNNGSLWRSYTLDSDDMQCQIREDFVARVWDL